MTAQNTPCTKPELCGVQSHRPGTQALCQQSRGATAKNGSASLLGSTPSLATTPKEIPSERVLGESEVEAIAEVLLEDPVMKEMGRTLNGPHSTATEGKMWRQLTSRLDNMGLEYSNDDALEIEKMIRAESGSPERASKTEAPASWTPTWSRDNDPKPFTGGKADPDAKWNTEKADTAGLKFKSADDSDYMQHLTPQQQEDYAELRSEVKDKLGLHLVVDSTYPDEEIPDRYIVHDDGRYILGNITEDHVALQLWGDFGDGKTIENQGGMDEYLKTVGKRFDELAEEYAKDGYWDK